MRFVLLCSILVVGFATPVLGQQSPSNFRDLSGGATVQRQRIDRAIETARELSVDEAIASLSQYNESYELAGLASKTSSSLGHCFMNSMLADRRISKIFEHLLSIPPKEADARAQQIFDDRFAVFVEEWRNFAKQGGYPKTGPPHHAASAGLLLCSFFCDRETLDSKIEQWNETIALSEFEKIDGVKFLAPSRLVDRLYQLNLLVISGHIHGKSVEQLNKELALLCLKISGDAKPFLQLTQMRMFKWSAETLDTDFTHRTRGVPASDNDVLVNLNGFSNANSSLRLQDPDVFDQFLNCVRTWRD
ncbi:MAG: hypothetical protein ABL921_13860 [Pirellula sp.]